MGYQDVYHLRDAPGAKAKQQFLRLHSGDEWLRKFLYFSLNPLISYNISEKTLETMLEKWDGVERPHGFSNIFDCCEYLSRLRGMDTATLMRIQSFLFSVKNEEERSLYAQLLSKTVRLGVTAKTVNKVMDNLIPEWEVQQAYIIDKYPLPERTEFWVTQKLNGVRATFFNGKLIARSGTPFKGLEHITNALRFAEQAGIVLDGELTLKNPGKLSDNEAFRTATGIINSESGKNKTEICYTVFDAIPVHDFESAEPAAVYKARRILLDTLTSRFEMDGPVRILPVLYHGTDQSMIDVLLEQMVREDKEGLMVNLDVPYRRTRHRGILKVKRFYTMDLPIVSCEEGSGRLSGTLGALVVSYKGNTLSVGTGFSDEQRREFWENREDLPGVLCEVKYKEVSSDKKTGAESLQFPVFVGLRYDKTEESHE